MTPARFAIIVAVATPLLASLSACGGDADAKAPDKGAAPITVAVEEVSTDAIAQPVTVTGTYGSRDEIPLAFKIGGVVARVLVDQGATVHKGQVLAALDLREIDALVDKARVGVDKAERDAARVKRLATDSVATLTQAQDAQSALDAARADYATARVNREYAIITAPDNGVILQRPVVAGTTINAGATVLTLGATNRGRVLRGGLADRDALRTRVGDSASVSFDALPNVRFHGTVTLLGKAADTRTGTYTVEIALRSTKDANIDALPNGLVGHANITVRAASNALYLPVDALLEANADSATVYTVGSESPHNANGGQIAVATPHAVRITQLVGDKAAVTGLADGTRVITRGAPYVTPGARVRVVGADAPIAKVGGAPR